MHPCLLLFKPTWLTSPAAGLAHVSASGADWNLVSQIATVPPDAPVAASVGREGCTSRQRNCSRTTCSTGRQELGQVGLVNMYTVHSMTNNEAVTNGHGCLNL
jgi:hypothetical protein